MQNYFRKNIRIVGYCSYFTCNLQAHLANYAYYGCKQSKNFPIAVCSHLHREPIHLDTLGGIAVCFVASIGQRVFPMQ